MRRILIGLVAVSVVGCSADQQVTDQEQAVQVQNDPSEEREVDSDLAFDSPKVPADVLLELEMGSTDTQIEARRILSSVEAVRFCEPITQGDDRAVPARH